MSSSSIDTANGTVIQGNLIYVETTNTSGLQAYSIRIEFEATYEG